MQRIKHPLLERPADGEFRFDGVMGQRIKANQNNWLLTAPKANPAMIEMFVSRDSGIRTPSKDLLSWSGEFAGKYIISAVQALRITRDSNLKTTLQSFVTELINSQSSDGYLGPFELNKRMIGRDGKPDRNCNNNDPAGCPLWDLWGQYHCMLGLYLWYCHSRDESALAACRRAADLIFQTFPGSGKQVSSAGAPATNQAIIHIFTLLYQETGEQTYLQMVRAIESDWNTPGSGNYIESALSEKEFFEFPQPAPRWESLHNIQAIAELYFITGDEKYRQAFEHIYRSIKKNDIHNTGGFSSGEEAKGNPYDPCAIETCATIAWIALNVDMLRITGDSRAADELEISTWNAVIGAQNADGKWWTYNTPMGGVPIPQSPGCQKPVPDPMFLGDRRPTLYDLDWQARAGSPQLSCCSANGPRGLGALSEWTIMIADDGIALNYYGPSTFSVTLPPSLSGKKVQLVQETDYPRSGLINLTLIPENQVGEEFILRLRVPGWSRNTQVMVNGERQQNVLPGTYLTIRRVWKPDDKITLNFDMSPRLLSGGPRPPNSRTDGDTTGRISVYAGPILLAYDPRFDIHDPQSLPAIDIAHPRIIESPDSETKPLLLLRFESAAGSLPITLCDFASAGAMSGPYLSGLPITENLWQFSRADGTVIASPIRLMADGTIQGHSHPNESRWGLEGDTLVFFAQNGQPSTKFTNRIWVGNHRIAFQGLLLPDRQIEHILIELDTAISNKLWQFSRADGTVIASPIRLMADGTVQGHSHPNEAHWGLEGDTLVFFAQNGQPSTKFTSIHTIDGKMKYDGKFLLSNQDTVHTLLELDFAWTSYISWLPGHS